MRQEIWAKPAELEIIASIWRYFEYWEGISLERWR